MPRNMGKDSCNGQPGDWDKDELEKKCPGPGQTSGGDFEKFTLDTFYVA